MTAVGTLIGLLVWFIIGCGALALVDDKDRRLFKWASSAPLPFLYELTVMAWPYILWLVWLDKHDDERNS